MQFYTIYATEAAKFGIKYWMLCDVKSSYVLRPRPYVGKEDRPQVGVEEHAVLSLMEPYHKTGKNMTTDNYFTLLNTARNLLQYNITMVGTLRKNKKKILAELHVDTRQQPLYTSRFLFTQENSIKFFITRPNRKKMYLCPHPCILLQLSTTTVPKRSQRRFCTITPPKVALIPLTKCCDVTALKLHLDDSL